MLDSQLQFSDVSLYANHFPPKLEQPAFTTFLSDKKMPFHSCQTIVERMAA
jgi:hypothetical protein